MRKISPHHTFLLLDYSQHLIRTIKTTPSSNFLELLGMQHHAQALLTGQPPPTPAAKAVRRGQGDEEGPRRRWRQPDFARARPLAAAEEDGGRWRGWEARRLGFPPRHPRGGERESRGRFHKRKRPDGLSNGYAIKHDAMGFITQPTRPHGHTNQMTKDLFDSHDFSSNLVY
jgi:hypothetical protein